MGNEVKNMTKIRANVIMAGVVGPTSTKASSGMMYIRAAPPWGKKEWVLARMPRRRSKESNDSSAPKRRYYHTLEELERMRKTKEKR